MIIRAMKLELNRISLIDIEDKDDIQCYRNEVGGVFETIRLKDGGLMLASKEGLIKKHPHNDLASYISERHIYGTALIVGMDISGFFCDVPEQYFVWLGN